jgi:hypothetical protein
LVLRDPCAEALEDREPWPCVGGLRGAGRFDSL